jgi:hypothetical protein
MVGILQWLPQIPLWLYSIWFVILDLMERILYTLSNTKLNSCGDFILSIIQILGWTPHLQTGIILKVLFGLFTTLGFNCRKSYVDDFPIPNAISFATQFNANITKKWDTIMSYLLYHQTCIKCTIIINYPTLTVITAIYFQFGTVWTFRTLPKEEIVRH